MWGKHFDTTPIDWQLSTLTQTLYSFGITLISLVLAVFLFICGPYRYAFWVVALLQISAVTLQIYTLMQYTSTLVEDGIIRTYHQLEMGYKLAWEAAAFNIFSALLYFLP